MMCFYDRLRWKLGLPSLPIIDASSIADAIDALPTAMGWSRHPLMPFSLRRRR